MSSIKKPQYQKLEPIEHIIKRPDMYVGSTKNKTYEEYTAIKDPLNGEFTIKKEMVKYSPAILRIFVEILSNAIDNVERSNKADIKCSKIKVNIDQKTGLTSILNDGAIVPIEMNEEYKCYNHSMIFGQLLSGSSYDDEEERLISGRNGLGGKCTNVFSTYFRVVGVDPINNKILTQEWRNNMRTTSPPVVKDSKLKNGYTEVSWIPDFKQFEIEGYTDDIVNLYTKFVIDASMLVKNVKVYLNDELIPVKNLSSYAKLYVVGGAPPTTPLEEIVDGDCDDGGDDEDKSLTTTKSSKSRVVWGAPLTAITFGSCDVVLTPSNGEFEMISFVNGVYTRLGGVHVDNWSEALFRPLVDKLNKKGKAQITIRDVKQFFRIFVTAIVNRPEFNSQSKDKLESPSVEVEVKTAVISKIMKWSVIDSIKNIIKGKEMVVLKKTERKKKGFVKIEGLDQANLAGTKRSSDCVLIICEGLSAKTYAVCGIDIKVKGVACTGRDFYGIYPIRGKCLNPRNATPTSIAKNREITDIIQAIGLRYDIDYTDDENFKELRYGKIMFLADADCFADDSALLIKKNNIISVMSINNLYKENNDINTIDGDTQLVEHIDVWSDKGWVNIQAIRRKKTTKRMITINTYSGLVRCTEDHKFLLETGEEIKACDIKIGDKLLRSRKIKSIPETNNTTHKELSNIMKDLQCYNSTKYTNKKDIQDCIDKELSYCVLYKQPTETFYNITKDEAWFWGIFFADGTCGVYTFEKDRKKANNRNTLNSQNRWKKWIEYHSNKVTEYTEQFDIAKKNNQNYGGITKKLRISKKRLEKAIENSTRTSKESKSILMRTDYSFSLSNCDYVKIDRSFNILKESYPEYNWTIIETKVKENYQRAYRVVLNGGVKVKNFIECMRHRFYTPDKLKKVPDEILNNTVEIQQAFYDGYYDGDGFRQLKATKNSEGFDILGQVGAQGLCYLVERLGYFSSIKEKIENPNVFTIHVSKRYHRFNPSEVREIYDIDYKDRYVYDIETESGKINAGVGNMIQRQCDGLHIEGLLLNLFHYLFPTLLQRKTPFIVSMKTPIVRVKGKKASSDLLFYDESRFIKYAKTHPNLNMKYYKGLGTTKAEDVPDTFGQKIVNYVKNNSTDTTMDETFNKKHSDKRKTWMADYKPNDDYSLDDFGSNTNMTITDFINNDLIKFSISDCKRSIPSLIDGLKESQRKILYAVKKRNLTYGSKKGLKVAQLGGYVAELTNYHHGEQNLYETITKMAGDYIGSNNIPLLYRDGMFGSRLEFGKDAASARYIYTKMDYLTHLIFPESDDVLLEKVIDDGDEVEPRFYVPIIPMVLVNGVTAAIGTGWSSYIPNYNPIDIVNYVKAWIKGEGIVLENNLKPWYKDFIGTIEVDERKKGEDQPLRFVSNGIITKSSKAKDYEISELPIGTSTNSYKEYLEDLIEQKKIKSMKNYSSQKLVKFVITEIDDGINPSIETLKLSSTINTSNMVLFNEHDQLKNYPKVEDIINEFCRVRLQYYKLRKAYLIKQLEYDIKFLGNKERFVSEIVGKKLNIMNVEESVLIEKLQENDYDDINSDNFAYLLNMNVRVFTVDKITTLRKDIEKKEAELEIMKKTNESDTWLGELDAFVGAM